MGGDRSMSDQAYKLRKLAEAGMYNAIALDVRTPRSPKVRTRCTSIAVTSGKGGVGKTNIALSLSIALSRMKKKVLLFDGDLGLANLHLLLGVAPRFNLSHVFMGDRRLQEIIWDGPLGVSVLPGASGIEEMANLGVSAIDRAGTLLEELEQEYDFLIIDTAAGIGASATRLASRTDCALVVLTPEPTSLADAYATAKVLFEQGASRIAAVVNMATSGREGAETFDRLNTLVVKFLGKKVLSYGILPYEWDVPRSVRKQRAILLEKPGSRFSEKIQAVAWKVSGMSPAKPEGFFQRLWKARPMEA
jgi:flagellar biosynthesis protein FlhG